MEAIAILLIAASFLWRGERLAKRYFDLKEKQMEESKQKAPPKGETIPSILWMEAMRESEPWARQDALKRFYQMYEELGSWDKVQQFALPDATEVV